MRYEYYYDLALLIGQKLISVRPHPSLPLFIYNYTAAAQSLPIKEWSPALCDCRGLILDRDGEVVGRPFRKFWNYEQVLSDIPSDLPFTVWEKLDGSLGIVCNYRGSLVVATRGSFESDQAKFAEKWLDHYNDRCEDAFGYRWLPTKGLTYLFEILYPENRIVVDYGETRELRLLAVMEADGRESLATFYAEDRFPKVKGFAPTQVQIVQDSILIQDDPGKEGYVLRWSNGFRAKVKFAEYCRLHQLITQVSTRSIWEMLRAGEEDKLEETVTRVPENFRAWVLAQRAKIIGDFNLIHHQAFDTFRQRPLLDTASNFISKKEQKKAFALWASKQENPSLLFGIYDRKGHIADQVWKMVEPRWSTPFRPGAEE